MMMHETLLLFVVTCLAVPLHFVVSPETPFDLAALCVETSLETATISNASSVADVATLPDSLLLDYSYDSSISAALSKNRSISMWEYQGKARYGNKESSYAEEFAKYVVALGWTQVVIIADAKTVNIKMAQTLGTKFPTVFSDSITLPLRPNLDYLNTVAGKIIKPSGRNLFAVLTDSTSALLLLRTLEAKKLNKVGFGYILSETAALYRGLTTDSTGLLASGVLYVAPAITATARSIEEREYLILKSIAKWQQSGESSVSSLLAAIDSALVLVNVNNTVPIIVANSSENLGPLDAVFPGNVATLPKSEKVIIPISINYDFINPDGYKYPFAAIGMRGYQIAVEEKNNGTDILPEFSVKDEHVGFSGFVMDYNFTRKQVIESRSRIGLIHYPLPSTMNSNLTYFVFKELNITVPICGGDAMATFDSPQDFPLLIFSKPFNTYTDLVIAKMFKYFKWHRVAIIYQKDGGSVEEAANIFISSASGYGINITNSETSRGLTEPIMNGPTAELNATLTEIINSDVRIIFMLHFDFQVILEAIYDRGVRSRFLFCTSIGISYTYFNGNSSRVAKMRAVANGALLFIPRVFVGPIGQRVLREMIVKDGYRYFPEGCFRYDGIMLYLHATEYLIRMGLDYEDPYEIAKAMRGTHFQGCGGIISIASGSNARADTEISVQNLKYFENNDTVLIEDVLYYNPFSTTLYKSVAPILWPDNSTLFTDTLVSTIDCPFLELMIRDFYYGRIIGYVASISICFFAFVSAVLIWKFFWNQKIGMLQSTEELSVNDVMQIISLLIEFVQLASMGPNSKYLNRFIFAIVNFTTFQPGMFINASGTMYWHLLFIAFCLVGIFVFFCSVKLLRLESKLSFLPCLSFATIFVDLLLPIFPSVMFLPIVLTLSQLFQCHHSIGHSLTSSFLNRDCYTFCWTGTHIIYAVVGSIALLVFIPLAIHAKPMLQEQQEFLHLKSQPRSLIANSVVQITLATINIALKEDNPEAHAASFLATISAYTMFILKFPQYNYNRYRLHSINMWHVITMVLVVAFSACSFEVSRDPGAAFVCFIAFVGLVLISLLVGVILQNVVAAFATKLVRRKMDTSNIIHFAFTFGNRAMRYLERHFSSSYFTENPTPNRITLVAR